MKTKVFISFCNAHLRGENGELKEVTYGCSHGERVYIVSEDRKYVNFKFVQPSFSITNIMSLPAPVFYLCTIDGRTFDKNFLESLLDRE